MSLNLILERNCLPNQKSTILVIVPSLKQTLSPTVNEELEKRWWSSVIPNNVPTRVFKLASNASKPVDNYTSTGINNAAISLLNELQKLVSTASRVVLIGFTLGGYIIKYALHHSHDHPVLRTVYSAVEAAIFVATAHNEEEEGPFHESFRASAAVELDRSPTGKSLKFLISEDYLARMRDFRKIGQLPRRLISFYEDKPTALKRRFNFLPSSLFRDSRLLHVVPRATASLNLGKSEQVIGLNLDHSQASDHPWLQPVLERHLKESITGLLSTFPVPETEKEPQEVPAPVTLVNGATGGSRQGSFRPTNPVRKKASSVKFNSLPEPADLPVRVIRPYQPNPVFIGRGADLKRLEKVLSPRFKVQNAQARLAISGLGGIGKTQTALAYAYSSSDCGDFRVTLWAHAETKAKLAQSYSDFDRELGLTTPVVSNQSDSREHVKRWLGYTKEPWLLILDNVDVPTDVLSDFLPSERGKGSILFTTRDIKSLGQFTGEIVELDKLADKDGLDLLLNLSKRDDNPANRHSASEICTRVSNHPLAISCIAGRVCSGKMSLAEYRDEYDNIDLVQKGKPMGGPEAIYQGDLGSALNVSCKHLERRAQTLLNVLSFLDADGISERFIYDGSKKSTLEALQMFSDANRLREPRENLCVESLIERNEESGTVWMHRLVQASCQLLMDKETFQHSFDCAFDLIFNIWPVPERHNRHDQRLWPTQQVLIHHIQTLAERYRQTQKLKNNPGSSPHCPLVVVTRKWPELLYNGAWYMYERGDFQSSRALLRTAEVYLGENAQDAELVLADIYGAYGSIDSESNDPSSCLNNFQKQLEYLHVAIGKGQIKRPTVREALAYGGLANAQMALKNYREAEPLYRKCLELWGDLPGDPSLYVPHLGVCLSLLGKTRDSAGLLGHWIKKREAEFGVRDRSFRTGVLYFALGNTQIRQGELDDAYQTHLFAFEILEVTNPGHHRLGDAHYKIGWHLKQKEEYEAAQERLGQALKIYQQHKIYANEMARTLFVLAEVAELLGETEIAAERRNEAEQLRRQILNSNCEQNGTEEDYDELIMFWSR